jgi:truncated hemoglobin YjbI
MSNPVAETLFDKYGGVPMATQMVRKLTERWLASTALRHYFDGMDKEALMSHQISVVAYVMGKPVAAYDSAAMRAAHHPLKISPSAYQEMVSLVRQVLLEMKIEGADISTILTTLDRQHHHLVAGAQPTPLYEGIDRRKLSRDES